MRVTTLGDPKFMSPIGQTVDDGLRVPLDIMQGAAAPKASDLTFELAGARPKLYFNPRRTTAGIVTCGGLCPGLNNVIRSVFQELHHAYDVKEVLGFRFGYQGLDPSNGLEPITLTPGFVDDIHNQGGTVLGTSRGPVDFAVAVDNLIKRGVNILFTVGGDGTQRGGNSLFHEAQKRGHMLSVVGIPKTIDNDVAFVSRSFGYQTAVEEASKVLDCAHVEAHSVEYGISIVKLMGRHAGFIAAGAALANQDVNFVLVPELPFRLDGPGGFMAALRERVLMRRHAVIVVAEGAGQDLLQNTEAERDASGNIKLEDVGLYLRDQIGNYFKEQNIPVTLRYFDPSYTIRSVPADSEDAMLCDQFARNAVHAAMAGKTGLVIGLVHDMFVHVPIDLLASQSKHMDTNGATWQSVLAATGQPARFE